MTRPPDSRFAPVARKRVDCTPSPSAPPGHQETTMSANRRGFLHLLLPLPVVGPFLGWLAPSLRAAPLPRDVYKELGVRSLINAAGTYTALGGSVMRPETVEAMARAARQFVPLIDLQEAVGRKIAALIGCEAALVSAGA